MYTHEHINAMTDDQLMKVVAEAKGYDRVRHNKDGKWMGGHDMGDEWGYGRERIPDYATDIAAAWGLLEQMADIGRVSLHNVGDHWQCAFEPHAGARYAVDVARPGDVYANAATAPRAICAAWLLWKQSAP